MYDYMRHMGFYNLQHMYKSYCDKTIVVIGFFKKMGFCTYKNFRL
jgi:hypothetical protein